MRIATPCLDCGVPQVHGPRCVLCTRSHDRRRRSSPAARGYDATYRRQRAAVLAAEPWCHASPCRYPETAGTRVNPLTADHVTPLSAGGYGGPLVPMCRSCNSAKGARTTGSSSVVVGSGRAFGRATVGLDAQPPQALGHAGKLLGGSVPVGTERRLAVTPGTRQLETTVEDLPLVEHDHSFCAPPADAANDRRSQWSPTSPEVSTAGGD